MGAQGIRNKTVFEGSGSADIPNVCTDAMKIGPGKYRLKCVANTSFETDLYFGRRG